MIGGQEVSRDRSERTVRWNDQITAGKRTDSGKNSPSRSYQLIYSVQYFGSLNDQIHNQNKEAKLLSCHISHQMVAKEKEGGFDSEDNIVIIINRTIGKFIFYQFLFSYFF